MRTLLQLLGAAGAGRARGEHRAPSIDTPHARPAARSVGHARRAVAWSWRVHHLHARAHATQVAWYSCRCQWRAAGRLGTGSAGGWLVNWRFKFSATTAIYGSTMRSHERLRSVAAALWPRPPTVGAACAAKELAVSRAVEQELRGGAEAAELTAAEAELAEQFYQLDLLGYLVIDNALSQQQVDTLNGILDARGITPGVPEEFEPATDAQGRERGHEEFIDFGGRTRPAGTTGSVIRFGSAGGGAPPCPGFLNWGQPFADLLLHPKIVPFLTEFLDASGYGVRLDRLYGMHMKEVEQKSGSGANGRQYPMGLHQGVVRRHTRTAT